jgi:MYXO-CTERM domain-containing protein
VRRSLTLLGLAVLAAITVLLVAVLVWGRGGEEAGPLVPIRPDPAPAIQASAALTPRNVHFGDTVRAQVDVTLNRARIDAGSVRIATDFAPWAPVAEPERTRRDGETTTHLRTTWVLRCLASACLPPGRALTAELTPATVTYDTLGPEAAAGKRLSARWPRLVAHTRLDQSDLEPPQSGGGRSPFESPWRADMVSMPPVSYRVEPETARTALYAGAGAFALLGLGLAFVGRPRRRPAPVAEAPAPPVLTPLEQALAVLEDPVAANGAADRRRALELVAAELAGRGNDDLAHAARRLAWSRQVPAVGSTTPLAEQARPALGLEAETEAQEAEAEAAESAETEPEEAKPGA